ncbi:HD domain-containing protein [Rubrivirga sp. IMCC43871]|uniref:HD domain-containing protein n=1 Tax=Rubrivirga sp. IMCC43871 TaxID=3391575 RepID=UPI00398FEB83
MPSRFTLFNDPVHGFVTVPKGLILSLVETPEVQRLRRIRQLGLGFLVFPGAVHTRFEHGIGAMALMDEALDTLREKGTVMATDEVEGALAAALLHDVGHGPFSHTLEHQLLAPGAQPFRHEQLSRALMARIDRRMGGALAAALAIFDGTYDRPFFHSLVASQLDMDRLDYLRRDSFYTGVAEGVVGVDRVIKTMRVHGGRLVVESKGAYAVENVLLSRRLMYWQVYLHKTVLAADHVLRAAFERARDRWGTDPALDATAPSLAYFLGGSATADDLDPASDGHDALLDAFTALDDTDVLYSLKRWATSDDRILADLAHRFVDRRLFRTTPLDAPATPEQLADWRERTARWLVADGLSSPHDAARDAGLYVAADTARVAAYRADGEAICILERDGTVRELSEAADAPTAYSLAARRDRAYVCLPKAIDP